MFKASSALIPFTIIDTISAWASSELVPETANTLASVFALTALLSDVATICYDTADNLLKGYEINALCKGSDYDFGPEALQ